MLIAIIPRPGPLVKQFVGFPAIRGDKGSYKNCYGYIHIFHFPDHVVNGIRIIEKGGMLLENREKSSEEKIIPLSNLQYNEMSRAIVILLDTMERSLG